MIRDTVVLGVGVPLPSATGFVTERSQSGRRAWLGQSEAPLAEPLLDRARGAGEHDEHTNAAAGAMALTVRGIELAYGVVEPGPDTYHTRPGYGTLWDRRLAAPLWRRR